MQHETRAVARGDDRTGKRARITACSAASGAAQSGGAANLAAVSRLRPGPAARYVHPKAAGLLDEEGDHDADLDITSESAANYLSWIASLCEPHLGRRVLEVGAGLGSITARYE